MKTKEEIKTLANKWALENSDILMETNSALNRGFVGGYTECQKYMAKERETIMETLLKIRDCKDYGNNSSTLAKELIESLINNFKLKT